jgi:hypothetical protein
VAEGVELFGAGQTTLPGEAVDPTDPGWDPSTDRPRVPTE